MKSQASGPFWLVFSTLTVNQILAAVSLAGEAPKPNPAVGPGRLGSEVNTFIGTGGVTYLCGNTFPGATVPFGMVRLSPDTVSPLGRRASNSSGYYYPDSRILGFSHTRLAGTGATEGGNFLVIPCTAETAKSHRHGLDAAYSHQQERAFPGYYGVTLPSPCQWTRIVTRLVNPNCYEARGSSAWDSFLQDRPGFSVFSGVFGFLPQGLLVPPRANRGQGIGPESLRVPAVSTLGLLYDRGPSEPTCSRP
jgi:Glycosyl hydrolase family 92 N-terminal domain